MIREGAAWGSLDEMSSARGGKHGISSEVMAGGVVVGCFSRVGLVARISLAA